MQHHSTRYGIPVVKLLNAYPQGSVGLVTAFEQLCKSAELNGYKLAQGELAASVCDQLHAGPSTGIKCLQCHYAETQYEQVEAVEQEMKLVRASKAAGDKAEQLAVYPVDIQEEDAGPSDEDLKKILAEIQD